MMLQGATYVAALKKGLEIAMSNSADSWTYSLKARKEIPLVQFPPGLFNIHHPLRLEARLASAFNSTRRWRPALPVKTRLIGWKRFLEFGGRLSVMCLSVGRRRGVRNRRSGCSDAGDIKPGPSLFMRFGFGAEVVVGLPVMGSVSLLYMAGVEVGLYDDRIDDIRFLALSGDEQNCWEAW